MIYNNQFNKLEIDYIHEKVEKTLPAKRVDIVSVRMIKEDSMLYKKRVIGSPQDVYELINQFLVDVDREYFVVVCLDIKNQPTAINICHIGSLNSSICTPKGSDETSNSIKCGLRNSRTQ